MANELHKNMEFDCEDTRNIICPYCGYEHIDSWECNASDDEYICHRCSEIFGYEREVTVSYTSFKTVDKGA